MVLRFLQWLPTERHHQISEEIWNTFGPCNKTFCVDIMSAFCSDECLAKQKSFSHSLTDLDLNSLTQNSNNIQKIPNKFVTTRVINREIYWIYSSSFSSSLFLFMNGSVREFLRLWTSAIWGVKVSCSYCTIAVNLIKILKNCLHMMRARSGLNLHRQLENKQTK